MRSPLFKKQLKEILGVEGLSAWAQRLGALRSAGHGDLADRLDRLLHAADATYVRLARLQQVTGEVSGDAVSEWNLRSGVIESGDRWKAQLGYAHTELEDRVSDWQRLVHPEDIEAVKTGISAHVAGHADLVEVEHRALARDGEWRWMLLRGRVFARDEEGAALRMVVVHRDLGAQKRSEISLIEARQSAEAADRARGEFLARMGQGMRMPANTILGMAELALDSKLDAEQRGYLGTVRASAESLLRVIDDLIDFSRIEAGTLDLEQVEFPLHALVSETVRSLCLSAHEKGLEVVCTVSPDAPERVLGDPARVRQILANLLENAIKFTERGEIVVGASLQSRDDNFVLIRFFVRDTGVGIPDDSRRIVFEAFRGADASAAQHGGGSGLGLAMCARLAKMMCGQIRVDSEPGKGSTFSFTARFVAARAAGLKPPPPNGLQGLRALVIDDNSTAAFHLGGILQRLGMVPTLMGNPVEAVAAFTEARSVGQPFALIVADADMPAPAGVALAAEDGELMSEALLLTVTTTSLREHRENRSDFRAATTLLKPIGPEDMLEAVLLALKLQPPPEIETGADVIASGLEAAPRPGLEILLVDDNPVSQQQAIRILETAGHRVELASSGREAADVLENRHFDIVLMDVEMPVMGGVEATELIRSREMRRTWAAAGRHRPEYIVAMTTHPMELERTRCLQAGMNDYLAKPIKADGLAEVIERSRRAGGEPETGFANLTGLWSE